MKGDFSRTTFDPLKHYKGVLHQQGRVWLDSDWNEDVSQRNYLLQQGTRDVIGKCGVPEPGTAFQTLPQERETQQALDDVIDGARDDSLVRAQKCEHYELEHAFRNDERRGDRNNVGLPRRRKQQLAQQGRNCE